MRLHELLMCSRGYNHIVVRSYENSERFPHAIGGGSPSVLLSRYPNLEIMDWFISDNILYVTCRKISV